MTRENLFVLLLFCSIAIAASSVAQPFENNLSSASDNDRPPSFDAVSTSRRQLDKRSLAVVVPRIMKVVGFISNAMSVFKFVSGMLTSNTEDLAQDKKIQDQLDELRQGFDRMAKEFALVKDQIQTVLVQLMELGLQVSYSSEEKFIIDVFDDVQMFLNQTNRHQLPDNLAQPLASKVVDLEFHLKTLVRGLLGRFHVNVDVMAKLRDATQVYNNSESIGAAIYFISFFSRGSATTKRCEINSSCLWPLLTWAGSLIPSTAERPT